MREEFEVYGKAIHPDFLVHPSPTVTGQYMENGGIALTLIVHILPKSALGAHYDTHKYCAHCKGTGEVKDTRDKIGGVLLCSAVVTIERTTVTNQPVYTRSATKKGKGRRVGP